MSRVSLLLRRLLPALIAAAIALVAPFAAAQLPPAPSASASAGAPAVEVAPDSPRASMRNFVELCRAGRYEEAARYLDTPAGKGADAPELARKLKTVLDRHMWDSGELALLASPYSSGNVADKLPPGVDELGTVPGPNGPEPVRLMRKGTPGGVIWVFPRSTIERIDIWYARLAERWLFDALPEPLLLPGPFDILWWQYLALPALVTVSWLVGKFFAWVTRKAIAKAVARTASKWDDALLEKIGAPLTLAWALGTFAVLVPRLGLYEPARDTMGKLIRAGFLAALFWSALRAIDVARIYLLEAAAPGLASARSLVPLGAQIVKLIALSAAALTVLQELGYPVASLITGLGIGGVALALAAQKTVENLFGSVSIGIDKPFRIGDFVRVEDVLGNVETVGLRSTRIRTQDRSLVTIPNGKLADMRIECIAARDRYRLHTVLGLEYGTTSGQLRQVVADIEAALREEPTFFKEGHTVAVKGIGASSIEVEVMAWFDTGGWDNFVPVRQKLLLRFLEIVEKNGTALAFPTQTLHFAEDERPPRLAEGPRRTESERPPRRAEGA